jgi:hypothetical protein
MAKKTILIHGASAVAFVAALLVADHWSGSLGVLIAYIVGVLSRDAVMRAPEGDE